MSTRRWRLRWPIYRAKRRDMSDYLTRYYAQGADTAHLIRQYDPPAPLVRPDPVISDRRGGGQPQPTRPNPGRPSERGSAPFIKEPK